MVPRILYQGGCTVRPGGPRHRAICGAFSLAEAPRIVGERPVRRGPRVATPPRWRSPPAGDRRRVLAGCEASSSGRRRPASRAHMTSRARLGRARRRRAYWRPRAPQSPAAAPALRQVKVALSVADRHLPAECPQTSPAVPSCAARSGKGGRAQRGARPPSQLPRFQARLADSHGERQHRSGGDGLPRGAQAHHDDRPVRALAPEGGGACSRGTGATSVVNEGAHPRPFVFASHPQCRSSSLITATRSVPGADLR